MLIYIHSSTLQKPDKIKEQNHTQAPKITIDPLPIIHLRLATKPISSKKITKNFKKKRGKHVKISIPWFVGVTFHGNGKKPSRKPDSSATLEHHMRQFGPKSLSSRTRVVSVTFIFKLDLRGRRSIPDWKIKTVLVGPWITKVLLTYIIYVFMDCYRGWFEREFFVDIKV